jgi:hypothetical protein
MMNCDASVRYAERFTAAAELMRRQRCRAMIQDGAMPQDDVSAAPRLMVILNAARPDAPMSMPRHAD